MSDTKNTQPDQNPDDQQGAVQDVDDPKVQQDTASGGAPEEPNEDD